MAPGIPGFAKEVSMDSWLTWGYWYMFLLLKELLQPDGLPARTHPLGRGVFNETLFLFFFFLFNLFFFFLGGRRLYHLQPPSFTFNRNSDLEQVCIQVYLGPPQSNDASVLKVFSSAHWAHSSFYFDSVFMLNRVSINIKKLVYIFLFVIWKRW